MKKFVFLTISVLLIAAACNKQASSPSPTPTSTSQTPQVYENSNLKVTLADGWTATAVKSNPAAVNIRKGDYILYINTQASQASGVEGGRFAEIAMGAPSADAVVTVQPSPPCGTKETSGDITIGNTGYKRVDLYVDSSVKEQYCAKPTYPVWYFSYVSDYRNGYFNYYQDGKNPALVITMAYNSKDVDNFPLKGSADLNLNLAEMTSIAQSLVIKQK